MKKLFFFSFFILPLFLYGQKITLQGKVIDSLDAALPFANIIADPVEEGSIAFSFSDKDGKYKLNLDKDVQYRLTTSHLGFIPDTLTWTAQKDSILNFILYEASESLDEIQLNYKQPIIVKEDTLTYRTDAFATGRERKLRDLLKNLPAMEVDKAGNVKVQGKKVTKVLVEDKTFFTGDSKLAVNNIPADAVDEIQVVDNYSRVGFLKGLEDSEEMAMNIMLKKKKKQFIFGEIEGGAGAKKRYKINPSLYYYSPKTSFNLIGDLNNMGQKSFTINDYLKFEGSTNKLIDNAKSYFTTRSDDFARFLSQKDYKESINKFAGLNFTQELNAKTRFSSYGIWSAMKNQTQTETINDYYSLEKLEERQNKGYQKPSFGIGRLSLESLLDNYTDLSLNTYFKYSDNYFLNDFSSVMLEEARFIETDLKSQDLSFKQEAEWHKQFNRTHTSSVLVQYEFKKNNPVTQWYTDQTILDELLPWEISPEYRLHQSKENTSHQLDAVLKHYLVLNRFNHLYFTLGSNLSFNQYLTSEGQLLEEGVLNDFTAAGFGNEVGFDLKDLHAGIQYKTQRGKLTIKPGLFLHQYFWSLQQFEERNKHHKTLLLPELNAKLKLKNGQQLTFDYKLKTQFPDIGQLANRYVLQSFNRAFRGNKELKNELYHQLSLWYMRVDLAQDLFYNLSANYRTKEKSIRSTLINEEGIDFISTPVLGNFEDRLLSINGRLEKGFGKIKTRIGGSWTNSTYESPFNQEIISYRQNSNSLNLGVRTNYSDFPNFNLSYRKSFSSFKSVSTSKFETDLFSASLEYDFLKNFGLQLDYELENYKNRNLSNHNFFNIANASLNYHKENTPWRFELSGTNLFNVKFKRRNSFSNILISDEKTFILPRMLMFNIIYKL